MLGHPPDQSNPLAHPREVPLATKAGDSDDASFKSEVQQFPTLAVPLSLSALCSLILVHLSSLSSSLREAMRPRMTELKVTGDISMSVLCIWGLKRVAATRQWLSCNQRQDVFVVSAGPFLPHPTTPHAQLRSLLSVSPCAL